MNNNYPTIPYVGYKDKNVKVPITFQAQHQPIQPGMEYKMNPLPIFENPNYVPSGKLKNKVVIISGGDWESSKCYVCKRRSRYCN